MLAFSPPDIAWSTARFAEAPDVSKWDVAFVGSDDEMDE